jgi:hypothetical protein
MHCDTGIVDPSDPQSGLLGETTGPSKPKFAGYPNRLGSHKRRRTNYLSTKLTAMIYEATPNLKRSAPKKAIAEQSIMRRIMLPANKCLELAAQQRSA